MKKFLIIMLTIFYFGSSSGMVLKLHQCLGISFLAINNSEKTCNSCPVKKEKDCCKTVFKVLKTNDTQKADLLRINFFKFFVVLPKAVFEEIPFKTLNEEKLAVRINAPPENRELALFIKHCNYRI